MAREEKYTTHVEPFLDKISEWYLTMTEAKIAKKLDISLSTFRKYKREHAELVNALNKGKNGLAEELKNSLRQKAKGFYYTETKRTYVIDEDGNKTGETKIEETEKYAPPDLGSIHLLLKNIDDEWRNDDKATLDYKYERLKLDKEKVDNNNW